VHAIPAAFENCRTSSALAHAAVTQYLYKHRILDIAKGGGAIAGTIESEPAIDAISSTRLAYGDLILRPVCE